MKLTLNRQNMRYWSEANPNEVDVEPLHSQRITAWSGISASGITGPYFCEDETGIAVIVTSGRYAHSANELFSTELRRRDHRLSSVTSNLPPTRRNNSTYCRQSMGTL